MRFSHRPSGSSRAPARMRKATRRVRRFGGDPRRDLHATRLLPSRSNWFGLPWQHQPHDRGMNPVSRSRQESTESASTPGRIPHPPRRSESAETTTDFLRRHRRPRVPPNESNWNSTPDGYVSVATGFGVIASGPMAGTIWIGDAAWIAEEPLEQPRNISK